VAVGPGQPDVCLTPGRKTKRRLNLNEWLVHEKPQDEVELEALGKVKISFLEKLLPGVSGDGDLSKGRCFAKENIAGLGMRVNLKSQSRFSGGKLVKVLNDTANHNFHSIEPEQDISRY
jgi:hypothetical protein